MKKNLRKFVLTTILVALAIVLDALVSVVPGLNLSMPMGGKFFGISMIPIVIVGLIFGLKYGLLAGLLFAIYDFSFSYLIYLSTLKETLESWTGTPWTLWHILGLIVFDYIIPFSAFGLIGFFSKKGLESSKNIILGISFVSIIRWISATFSGYLLWGSSIIAFSEQVKSGSENANIASKIFDFVGNNVLTYSMLYNLTYILTTGILVSIILVSTRKRLIAQFEKNDLYYK